jgi:hypothetical protein
MYRSITGQVYLTVWYAGRALAQSDVTAWQTAITSNSLPAYGTALMTNVVGYWAGPAIGNAIPNLVTNNDVGPLIFDTNPIVAVTNPTSAATLTGSVSLAATASNSGGFPIQSVSFQVDGLTVCTAPQTASPFSCSYNTAISVDGPHAFTATATDTAGLSTISAAISATTNNSTMGKTYFFAAAGSDAANCQTTGTACQTITKLNSIIGSVGIGESDTVSFNGGDSFAGCITLTAANTRSNLTYPATFTSYGTGRYTITQNCAFAGTSGAILINGASGLVIENGNLVAAAPALSTRAGLYITNTTNTVGAGNITVQNMQISGFTGLNGGGGCTDFGGEIMVDGAESSAGLTNISLLDNILNGSSTTSSDDNGIDGFADGQNIITANYQGNDVHYVGGSAGCGFIGNGIIFDGVASGTASFNLTHDNGGNNNHCGGPAGQWTAQVNVISIKFGESYNMLGLPGACDGDGFDIDEQSQNVTTEYNYSHDNYGDSFPSYFTAPWTGNQYRYNISEHDTQLHGGGVGCISMTNAGSLVYYAYNNTCWMDTPNPSLAGLRPGGFAFCCNLNDVTTATGAIANNFLGVTENDQNAVLFMANNGGALAFPNIPFKSNWYYNITGTGATQWIYGAIYSSLSAWKAAVPGGDTNAGTTTANFTAAGSDQTCSWTPATIVTWPPSGCPTGYVLLNTSPLLNNGIDMMATYGINPGAQDYYGNAIPRSGPLNNTGADGGNP